MRVRILMKVTEDDINEALKELDEQNKSIIDVEIRGCSGGWIETAIIKYQNMPQKGISRFNIG